MDFDDDLLEQRDKTLQRLKQALIEPNDLAKLDRLGRCDVAVEAWAQCSDTARRALLGDKWQSVRNCAELSQRGYAAW